MKHVEYPEEKLQSPGTKGRKYVRLFVCSRVGSLHCPTNRIQNVWGGKYVLAWKQSPATLQTRWADITAKWAGPLRWLSNDNDPLGAGKETSLADDGVSFFSGKMGAIITLLVAMSYKWPLRSLQTRWRVAQKDLCRSALWLNNLFHFLLHHFFFLLSVFWH